MKLVPKRAGSFRSFDGTSIYYEERGAGFPIILNYGIGCLINHWRHQIRHFSRNFRVIAYDYRAHHRSEMPVQRENLSIDALAQDLKALMDHLEIQKASLWGHSFGAQMLVRHTDLFPGFAHSLVFINGFTRNPLKGMFGNEWAERFFHSFRSGFGKLPETLSYLFKSTVQSSLAIRLSAMAGGFNLKLTSLKDIEIYARGMASMELDAFLELFDNMLQYDGTSFLHRIATPTMVIGGSQDSVTPANHQVKFHELIAGSEFFMVPYGSHCTQLDMPELVNLKIDSFLRALSIPQHSHPANCG
jgi:pimeloyl-ACP methyl ester carboxylesterase